MALLAPAMRRIRRRTCAKHRRATGGRGRCWTGPEKPAMDQVDVVEAEIEVDVSQTWSSEEKLKAMDFEQMGTAEIVEAKRLIAQIKLPVRPLVSRRTRAAQQGQIADWRATMRAAMRRGGRSANTGAKSAQNPLAQSGGTVRYFRVHVGLFPADPAFPA